MLRHVHIENKLDIRMGTAAFAGGLRAAHIEQQVCNRAAIAEIVAG